VTRIRFDQLEACRPPNMPAEAVVSVFRVPPESAGMRLDLFVQGQLKRTSRTKTQDIVRRSAFGVDGRPLRVNDRVMAEQHVLLWREPWDETPVPTDLPILYEDPHLFAIAKPAGVPVHPTARYHKNTVVKLLEKSRPGERFTLAHRLDRETSGVLLLAKSYEADRRIKRQLEKRDRVEKRYLAITWGAPETDCFRVELPLELDTASRLRVRMRVAHAETGLSAATSFQVLGRATAEDGRRYALIACDLETGRQHQIRVHLAAAGLPIVGDKLYGPDPELFARGVDSALTAADLELLEIGRHALHAERLAFDHPISGQRVTIVAPLADDLAAFWQRLVPAQRSGPRSPGHGSPTCPR
jgi:23S rRNA pseudouridine1911/1915/1917 synthase